MINIIKNVNESLREVGYELGGLIYIVLGIGFVLVGALGAWGILMLSVMFMLLGGEPLVSNLQSFVIYTVVGIVFIYIGLGMADISKNFKHYREFKRDEEEEKSAEKKFLKSLNDSQK